MKKKSFIMALALVLVFAVAVGGVVAWLTATTGPVKNTFTVGDINITLTETGAVDGKKSYQVIPGDTQKKDPKVTVKAGSEDCWLFVEIDETKNTMTVNGETVKIVDYAIATGWTQGDGTKIPANVYYRSVTGLTAAGASDAVFSVLANDQVTINDNVTKGQITATNQPTLTFTAAAVQQENIATVDKAFAQLPGDFTTP